MKTKRKAVALGDFDGMHLAHKTVATGAENVIIYCVNNEFSLLQKSIFERRFPNAVFADFEKLKNMSGEDFINDVLIDELGAEMLLCGFNFRFGKNASWSALDLRSYLEPKDVWVRILEHLDFEGEPISSSRIRKCLREGNVEAANKMLGYNFTFESEVIGGDRRGRTIGFPTCNTLVDDTMITPPNGVYITTCTIDGVTRNSVTNVGVKPTIGDYEKMIETHIFDFDEDVYGKQIRVDFIKHTRGEKKFNGIDELKKQIESDCIEARVWHRQNG